MLWIILKVALKSLLANKMRSLLAMLGIIIGVGAVISMLALGTGAKKQVMQRITSMGTNLLIVRPGGDYRKGIRSTTVETLKLTDAEAILDKIEGVEAVAPLVTARAQVKYFNENMNTTITGAPLTYITMRNFELEKGRVFTSVEKDHSARVAIVGNVVAEQLFGSQDPVGERFRIKNVNFRIIGRLKAKGDQGWFNPDDMVIIPYPTAMKQVIGQDFLNEIDVKIKEGMKLDKVEKRITRLLRQRHRIRMDEEEDFHIRNMAEIVAMASQFTQTFTFLLGGIASISLIVGGIGIMNIMLVTVTERTREIGVRKAIGARNRDILRQFLLEAIIISGLGGLMGIGLGYAAAESIRQFTAYQTIIELRSILLSITVSAAVGIFFGYYPASRAAKLDPIEALRYE
ncbi:MAG: ABC transporter permease [Candidatus Schekmanbacteria bacterium]|nr:ABC transporter permease [Candidatus Schekmanbacteria bacterium]